MSETDTKKNRFVGKASTKTTKFVDEDLQINKLNINQVLQIQDITDGAADKGQTRSSIEILSAVIRAGAPELRDLTQTELQEFPMEDLAKLSNEIMSFSGLA